MSLAANILWIVFGGLFAAIGYWIGGLILCLTIIGIPFGLKSISFGFTVLAPFGKRVVGVPRGEGCLALVFNILWLVLFGWEIALIHLTFAILLGITIIGLPFAAQHLKLAQVALFPYSYDLR